MYGKKLCVFAGYRQRLASKYRANKRYGVAWRDINDGETLCLYKRHRFLHKS